MEKEYIKASEYAKKMSLHIRTVYRYYHNGKIKKQELFLFLILLKIKMKIILKIKLFYMQEYLQIKTKTI